MDRSARARTARTQADWLRRRTSNLVSSKTGILAKDSIASRYWLTKLETASRQPASLSPATRPPSTMLVANRFTSHSHGPGIDSSKSLRSKTRCPSGAANAPRLSTCASPHICTTSPVVGHSDRSYAMRGAAPRKKPKGEAAMRPTLIGTSSFSRCLLMRASRTRGSSRCSDGRHSPWSIRLTTERKLRPCSRRSAALGIGSGLAIRLTRLDLTGDTPA